MAEFEKFGGALTTRQQEAIKSWEAQMEAEKAASESAGTNDKGAGKPKTDTSLVPVTVEDVQKKQSGESRSMVAYYAAGIGVMFLLFSVAGASGSLLEDQEAGILERIISSPLGMTRLLLANWTWISMMGMVSMFTLYLFATFVFGLGPWTGARIVFVHRHHAFHRVCCIGAGAAVGYGLSNPRTTGGYLHRHHPGHERRGWQHGAPLCDARDRARNQLVGEL